MANEKKLSLILSAKDRMSSVIAGGLKKTDKQFERLTKRIQGVSKGFNDIGNKSLKAGTVMIGAIVAGVGAVAKFGQATASAGDKIDKMSQKIGMSRKAYQEWDYVMSQNGGNVDGLTMGYKTLETQIEGFIKGSKSQTALFKELGISVKDSNGHLRSQEDIFASSVRAIQKIQNPTQKAIYANQLFGRSAIDMRPLLNQTAQSVDALKKKANDLGFIMSDKDVDAAVKLTDTIDTLKRTFGGLGRNLGVQLIPVMQEVSDAIIANMPRIKNEVVPVLSKLIQGLGWAVTHLSGTGVVIGASLIGFGLLSKAIGGTLNMLVNIGNGIRNFHKFMEIHKFTQEVKFIRILSGAFMQLGASIMATPVGWLAAGVAGIVIGAVIIRKYWTPITQLFRGIWEGIKISLKPAFDSIGTALKPLSPMFKTLGGWISNAWNWFTKLLKPVNTTGKASHDLGVKIGEVIGGLIKLGGNFVWFLARINPITGPIIAIWKNFAKIKEWADFAGNAIKSFFSRFGKKEVNIKVSSDANISGKKPDGSHADGLDYVPYDGYTAELHKGERVLTAKENAQLRKIGQIGGITLVYNPQISMKGNNNSDDLQKILDAHARKVLTMLKEELRRQRVRAYAD